MRVRNIWIVIMLMGTSVCASAQWLNHPTPGTPRTKDGKPNLAAPAPRRGGKPDLSGVWQVESSPRKELAPTCSPAAKTVWEKTTPSKYFINFFSDFPFWSGAVSARRRGLFRERMQSGQKPPTLCPPPSLPLEDIVPGPFKIVSTPGLAHDAV